MSGQWLPQRDPATGVMPAAPWHIQEVSALLDHRLALTFRDGLTSIADFSAIRSAGNAGLYAPLADTDYFAQVLIQLGVLTWSNGADLDPAWLHGNLATHKTWSVSF